MVLTRCARQQRHRSTAAPPQPGQRQQPRPDQVAREVLLTDPEHPLLPFAPDLHEGRKNELAQHGFKPEGREALIEHRLHGRLVVPVDRRQQARCRVLEQPR